MTGDGWQFIGRPRSSSSWALLDGAKKDSGNDSLESWSDRSAIVA
jgi:hypothetical protein